MISPYRKQPYECLHSIPEDLEKDLKSQQMTVFTNSYCPYSVEALETLRAGNVQVVNIVVDRLKHSGAVIAELEKRSGTR